MAYCPKCGSKVDEEAGFCPKCGAALKPSQHQYTASPSTSYGYNREEKHEKREKEEKNEKYEKSEKSQQGPLRFIGPIVGGLVMIILGLVFLFPQMMRQEIWGLLLAAVGIIIIVGGIYAAINASKRNPKT